MRCGMHCANGRPVKNPFILCSVCAFLVVAMVVGMRSAVALPEQKNAVDMSQNIPSIGKVQVLNGCGAGGAASIVADFLRAKKFDVKNIGNAPMSNYQSTLVASRARDMSVAKQVAGALNTDAVFLMRSQDTLYNVTVYVGADYKDRAR
jgi:LytR cell envelope-related transcriptional attenuator